MEVIAALIVFLLAAGGLGLGLALGRGPARSCGGVQCAAGGACAACPRRRERQEDAP